MNRNQLTSFIKISSLFICFVLSMPMMPMSRRAAVVRAAEKVQSAPTKQAEVLTLLQDQLNNVQPSSDETRTIQEIKKLFMQLAPEHQKALQSAYDAYLKSYQQVQGQRTPKDKHEAQARLEAQRKMFIQDITKLQQDALAVDKSVSNRLMNRLFTFAHDHKNALIAMTSILGVGTGIYCVHQYEFSHVQVPPKPPVPPVTDRQNPLVISVVPVVNPPDQPTLNPQPVPAPHITSMPVPTSSTVPSTPTVPGNNFDSAAQPEPYQVKPNIVNGQPQPNTNSTATIPVKIPGKLDPVLQAKISEVVGSPKPTTSGVAKSKEPTISAPVEPQEPLAPAPAPKTLVSNPGGNPPPAPIPGKTTKKLPAAANPAQSSPVPVVGSPAEPLPVPTQPTVSTNNGVMNELQTKLLARKNKQSDATQPDTSMVPPAKTPKIKEDDITRKYEQRLNDLKRILGLNNFNNYVREKYLDLVKKELEDTPDNWKKIETIFTAANNNPFLNNPKTGSRSLPQRPTSVSPNEKKMDPLSVGKKGKIPLEGLLPVFNHENTHKQKSLASMSSEEQRAQFKRSIGIANTKIKELKGSYQEGKITEENYNDSSARLNQALLRLEQNLANFERDYPSTTSVASSIPGVVTPTFPTRIASVDIMGNYDSDEEDDFGTLMVQDMIKTAEHGSGWVTYQWRHATDEVQDLTRAVIMERPNTTRSSLPVTIAPTSASAAPAPVVVPVVNNSQPQPSASLLTKVGSTPPIAPGPMPTDWQAKPKITEPLPVDEKQEPSHKDVVKKPMSVNNSPITHEDLASQALLAKGKQTAASTSLEDSWGPDMTASHIEQTTPVTPKPITSEKRDSDCSIEELLSQLNEVSGNITANNEKKKKKLTVPEQREQEELLKRKKSIEDAIKTHNLLHPEKEAAGDINTIVHVIATAAKEKGLTNDGLNALPVVVGNQNDLSASGNWNPTGSVIEPDPISKRKIKKNN